MGMLGLLKSRFGCTVTGVSIRSDRPVRLCRWKVEGLVDLHQALYFFTYRNQKHIP